MSLVDANMRTKIEDLHRRMESSLDYLPEVDDGGTDVEYKNSDIEEFVNRITSVTIDALKANGKNAL